MRRDRRALWNICLKHGYALEDLLAAEREVFEDPDGLAIDIPNRSTRARVV
jgi:hypothetical protein